MGVNGTGGQRVMFRSTFSMGRGVPSLSIRAHGSSGEGSAAQAVAMPRRIFPGTPLGRRRFLRALSWVSGTVDWRRAFFVRCRPGTALSPLRARAGAALVFFWADAQ